MEILDNQQDVVTPDLAYILGVYLGDGSIYCNHKRNDTLIFSLEAIDRDFVEETKRILELLLQRSFTIKESNRNKTPLYKLRFGNNSFCKWLQNETRCKNELPKCIPLENTPVTKRFLEGLLDSEGYVSVSKKPQPRYKRLSYKLGIAMSSPWIDELPKYFEAVGVRITSKRTRLCNKMTKPSTEYSLSLLDFIPSGLKFNIKRKQDRVNTYAKLLQTSSETEVLARHRKYTVDTHKSEGTVQTASKDVELSRNA
jgi:hypothetical protein